MAIQFTPEQEKVIQLHNRNILVSAAAGSGKTAVLVERIIQMVCSETHPVDIDRLLVVTFTNAAAAEMRERISRAIGARLEENPESAHLQRQSALVHHAQITTIDSFCLFVIRNNFNDIELDPSFRVADEGELKLLRQDVLTELLEEKFAQQDPDFLHCVECYAAAGREEILEKHLLNLYEFAISYPWPEEWLEERKQDYHIESIQELEQTDWICFALEHIKHLLADAREQYKDALRLCAKPDGPWMYAGLLEQEMQTVEQCLEADTFSKMGEVLAAIEFQRLPAKKDPNTDSEKRELAKGMRGTVKDIVADIRKRYFSTPLELAVEQSLYSERAVVQLLELCGEFKRRFDEKKREKNLLDFSDMEHFALNILLQKTEDGLKATKTAQEYREFFEEVMIDEYQDSNLVQEYLLKAVSGEEEGRFNRFMVGDVKQSIYKFRLARPELFMEKYNTYSQEESSLQRIDLHKNFRSRREVISCVNGIFEQLMGERLGGITYDKAAALNCGALYPESKDCETELLLMQKEEKAGNGEAAGARELEALGIARRIRRLVQEFQVTDKESGQLRPCRYQDIVVLLRTNSGWDEVFKKVFASQGVPAHITSKTGYFSTTEIQTLMQLLRVLDNPLQDIPLFGTMKSIFGKFTEEEIVQVRTFSGKKRLYESLKEYENKGPEESLREKSAFFLTLLSGYRKKVVYLPVRKLLQTLIADFDYLYYVTALPAGSQRKANVEMLLEKAADFEKTSYYGLFHFIRYVEQMEKYDVDYGEATIQDENADVVRIMSIHKSKGLEFPVAFVAGLSKRFNMQDASQMLIADVDMGIGTDYLDPELRMMNKTLRKSVMTRKMQLDNLGEELRVLYVALTRAKEKLIMTASLEKPEEKLSACQGLAERESRLLPYYLLTGAASYLDYILPASIRMLELKPQIFTAEKLAEAEINELVQSAGRDEKQMLLGKAQEFIDEQLSQEIGERFGYCYPYENLSSLYTKTTVSELKMAALREQGEEAGVLFAEERIVPYVPAFMRKKEEVSGTVRGSAFHKAMELFDFTSLPELLKLEEEAQCQKLTETLDALKQEGRLSSEYRQALVIPKLLQFLHSGLAGRMCRAAGEEKLYKEQPFVYGIDAIRLNPQFPAEEKVMIQGIIDVFFIEEDGMVLADYKTDVIQEKAELTERYHTQLDYYAEALEAIWKLPVKERILYSFYLGEEIKE